MVPVACWGASLPAFSLAFAREAPGACSWRDKGGAPYTWHRWEALHGWIEPPDATPHYRASADMAALQLGMLTRLEESGKEPAVVIGAGVPPHWLAHPMAASGILVRGALVDWRWRSGRMKVIVRGESLRVRSADSFPPQARLVVHCSKVPWQQ